MDDKLEILMQSSEFKEFQKKNPEYDIYKCSLTESDISTLQEEYPEYKLFPSNPKKVVAFTLISKVLMEKGYPKLKAYIDGEGKTILHIFLVK
jgi:hypothetical protein